MRWSRRASCWCRCNANSLRSKDLASCLQTVERIRARLQSAAVDPWRRADHVRPPQQSVAAGRRRCPRLPRQRGVRNGRAAQRAAVGSAEPWPSGADLRSANARDRRPISGLRGKSWRGCRAWRRRRHEEGDRPWARPERADRRGGPRRQGRRPRPPDGGVRAIEIGRIRPNPSQPRQHFDEQAIGELAASIAERGVLQPILVRAVDDGYEIGRRRAPLARGAEGAAP